MTSNLPASCCTIGVTHEGKAAGELKDADGIPMYLSYPKDKSTSRAILILTDIMGYKFINVQLIADQLAANGYFVVVPDLFHGDPVALNPGPGFDLMKWLSSHGSPTVDPIVEGTLKFMREKWGCEKIGGVGYCFGGKYVVRFLKQGKIDAGYVAHPSFVEAGELQAIQGPLSIAAAEHDHIFPAVKRHESEAILNNLDVPWQISLYSKVEHGFAVRADLSSPSVKWAKEQAFLQAIRWFQEHTVTT